ncbi:type II toxin-antitoxin system RelE/ParE family toxin [Paraglaciecola sp. MB-3u-78]|jgi:toxin ParE1/3/4|uniref:type II toxin-antitoxin system RelE/ParE family toxin n=1 Tax=Paraglaciecola sp. MB-3u-78 TaxID=2058332 RepID=UPI000C3231F9|nr:type II toxin-antitoxin system RelE/ParE family toxin [Paraglaciecola sp. MB-3u-78]PKG98359.1 plasmid stabilization protein ParE [Paraglaciecola sp. MB-3u-78]
MRAFTLTNKAKADLKSIAVYTQRKWGKEQRKIYLRQFDDAFHMLSKTPVVGSKCDFIKEGYRKFPAASHLVFYHSVNQSEIEIVRLLHKRMDAEAQLKNP